MRCISLWQPYATLVAIAAKTIETRHWRTEYRGPLAIQAAKRAPEWSEDEETRQEIDSVLQAAGYCSSKDYKGSKVERSPISAHVRRLELPTGAVVATCELTDCVEMTTGNFLGLEFIDLGDAWNDRIYDDLHSRETFRDEYFFGNYAAGRFAFILSKIKKLEKPIPERGRQLFWDWSPPAVIA